MEEVVKEVTPEVTPEVKEVTPETKGENMIPKSRFDEVNAKYKEMAEKISAFENAEAERQKEAEQKELQLKQEQGKFEELFQASQKELETYKQYESRTTELEGLISNMVETKLETIPEEMRDLVPTNLTPEAKLDWLTKAESKGLFGTLKTEVKEVGKPSNKSNEQPKVDKANLSPLDKILAGLGK
jgi:ribonucleoside-triphosphate reductase